MGLKADIIIWDLTTLTLMHRMSLHKVGTKSFHGVLDTTQVQYSSAAGQSASFGLFL